MDQEQDLPARSQSMAGPTYENPNEEQTYNAPPAAEPPAEPADDEEKDDTVA